MKMVLWCEPERVAARHVADYETSRVDFRRSAGRPAEFRQSRSRGSGPSSTSTASSRNRASISIAKISISTRCGYWRGNDAPDRQGITENLHVQGHLAYWDELRRRHPDMLIDTCASGGRRNDLESLRRAVPLLRSDFQAPRDPGDVDAGMPATRHTRTGCRCGCPYYGTGEYYNNGYSVRSHFCQGMGIGYNPAIMPVDWPRLKKTLADWRAVVDEFYGDYYPLTPYSLSEDVWMAWQFNRPETGTGMVQAFRHINSVYESVRVKLQGLDKDAVYTLTNLDVPGTTEMTGRELSENGLVIAIKEQPGSALITYKKKP